MSRSITLCSIVFLTILIQAGCKSSDSGPVSIGDGGVLAGNVNDSSTGVPLSGVIITLTPGSRSTTTDANGYYIMDSIAAGVYRVQFSKAGYNTFGDSATVINAKLTTHDGRLGIAIVKGLEIVDWKPLASGTTEVLCGVCYADPNTIYAVGFNGAVLRSADRGATWTRMNAGTSENLYCVHFKTATTGFIMGNNGLIKTTTDGGGSWQQQAGNGYNFRNLSFVDANTGYAVGGLGGSSGVVYKTTDGGFSWTNLSNNLTAPTGLYGVAFKDAQVGFVGGGFSLIYRTQDGGATWTQLSPGITSDFLAADCTDAFNGTIVGTGGVVAHTTNGGAVWTKMNSGVSVDLKGVTFTDARNGTVVGASGTILHTTNGGASWPFQSHGSGTLYESAFADSVHGVVVGEGGTILGSVVQ